MAHSWRSDLLNFSKSVIKLLVHSDHCLEVSLHSRFDLAGRLIQMTYFFLNPFLPFLHETQVLSNAVYFGSDRTGAAALELFLQLGDFSHENLMFLVSFGLHFI